jgi:hypothetical protein
MAFEAFKVLAQGFDYSFSLLIILYVMDHSVAYSNIAHLGSSFILMM